MAIRPGDVIKIADPAKGAVRLGGRITAVDGLNITLDQEPDFADWTGAKLSWMVADADGEPALQEANVTAHTDNVVTIDSDGGNTPSPPSLG